MRVRVCVGGGGADLELHSSLCVCQAEAEGFSHFHLYVCAAFLLEWRKQIFSTGDFQVAFLTRFSARVNVRPAADTWLRRSLLVKASLV